MKKEILLCGHSTVANISVTEEHEQNPFLTSTMDGPEPEDQVVRELDVYLSNGQLGQETKVHP